MIKTISTVYNKLGQVETYTDAAENTAAYKYDVDGRVTSVNTGRGTEVFTYSPTSGLPTELLNEYGASKLTFTAGYDVEGNMLTEHYPNGMTATYTYNAVGKPIGLEYKKVTDCTEKCTWFSESVLPSIHGQWLEAAHFHIDVLQRRGEADRGTRTPYRVCARPSYRAYDKDAESDKSDDREPGTEGNTATTGGKVESHVYNTADRLVDTGATYNTFGDITALPAGLGRSGIEEHLLRRRAGGDARTGETDTRVCL